MVMGEGASFFPQIIAGAPGYCQEGSGALKGFQYVIWHTIEEIWNFSFKQILPIDVKTL
jgi:hypothetical protein